MKKSKIIVLSVAGAIILFLALSFSRVIPQLCIIPDMIRVGVDYISLQKNPVKTKASDIQTMLTETQVQHPFILADAEHFAIAKEEYETKTFSAYAESCFEKVFSAAEALLYTPTLPYELDEEDCILPIAREVGNRIIILSFAWQMTGKQVYADRAWEELQNVCGYDDWCVSHFLDPSEMALAVSIGRDWLDEYLTEEQIALLSEKTWEYAITPALSKNYLKNWFTWSKNNWNSICYSGIGIACMTFADENTEKAAQFLSMCAANMPIAFENFTPDGVYAEGPGYFESGMNALVYFIATAENRFDSDFGLSEIDGFEELGSFPLAVTSTAGEFNFGDNKSARCFSPVLHWYADRYDNPLLCSYQCNAVPNPPSSEQSVETNGEGKQNAQNLLWLNRDFENTTYDYSSEETSRLYTSDVGQCFAVMRNAFFTPDECFAAIKGGYNYTNHGNLDIGTFVYDTNGVRWAEELGPGNYDAPGYFVNLPGGGRWQQYTTRAEGQNTLVINPDGKKDDQYALAQCDFLSFDNTDGISTAVLDMTEAYRIFGVKTAVRQFTMDTSTGALTVTDTVQCKKPSEIYWFMHTKADIAVSDDGKTATLTRDGQTLTAVSLQDGTFSVMPAQSLSGKYEYDKEYPELQKLTVHLTDIIDAEIKITFTP